MAIFTNRASRRRIFLRPRHIFGRERTCDTVLHNPEASRLHASVRWNGRLWEITDHSRNGTRLDGAPLRTGMAVLLKVGNVIAFGADDACAWEAQDLSAPQAMLWPLDADGEPVPLHCATSLPGTAHVRPVIHPGDDGRWLCSSADGVRPLQDGDELRFGGRSWCFVSPGDHMGTLEAPGRPARDVPMLHFRVSLDEEHVQLQLECAAGTMDLGERSHHYTLLTLARLRVADADRGLEAAAQGWIEHERLARMLGLDPAHLNIHVFRLRKQFAVLPPAAGLPDPVERRRGELRLGEVRFEIVRGCARQAVFDPFRLPATHLLLAH